MPEKYYRLVLASISSLLKGFMQDFALHCVSPSRSVLMERMASLTLAGVILCTTLVSPTKQRTTNLCTSQIKPRESKRERYLSINKNVMVNECMISLN